MISENLSVMFFNNFPSERIGEISRNIIPSIGKLGIVLIVDLRVLVRFCDMLIALWVGRGTPDQRPGALCVLILI
jgi:hypothetical protein